MYKGGSDIKPSKSNQIALALFFELSGWIAIPVIAAMFLGSWLDGKFGTEPILILICIGAAFIVTVVGLAKRGRKMMREVDEDKSKEIN